MPREQCVEELIKKVSEGAKDIKPEDMQSYYICAYLPMMVSCLASIADSLEKIASKDDLSSRIPIQPVYKEEKE